MAPDYVYIVRRLATPPSNLFGMGKRSPGDLLSSEPIRLLLMMLGFSDSRFELFFSILMPMRFPGLFVSSLGYGTTFWSGEERLVLFCGLLIAFWENIRFLSSYIWDMSCMKSATEFYCVVILSPEPSLIPDMLKISFSSSFISSLIIGCVFAEVINFLCDCDLQPPW